MEGWTCCTKILWFRGFSRLSRTSLWDTPLPASDEDFLLACFPKLEADEGLEDKAWGTNPSDAKVGFSPSPKVKAIRAYPLDSRVECY